MTGSDDELHETPGERPATWENVVVGRATEALGRVLHDERAVDEGEEQVEAAHEVREEYRAQHRHHAD